MNSSLSHLSLSRVALRSLALLAVALLAGCSWLKREPVINVPLQDSAVKQYRYATEQRQNMALELISDRTKLNNARKVVRREFEMVPENFPHDRRWTPLARLEVIEMDAALDIARARAGKAAVRKALTEFSTLGAQYPEYDFIQAKSILDRGICHKRLNQFAEAQKCFREVRDKFAQHPDGVISGLAQQAGSLYNQVYVNE